jgi:hypothetical protein
LLNEIKPLQSRSAVIANARLRSDLSYKLEKDIVVSPPTLLAKHSLRLIGGVVLISAQRQRSGN